MPVYAYMSNDPDITCFKDRCELLYMLINWGAELPTQRSRTPWLQTYIDKRNQALRAKRDAVLALMCCLKSVRRRAAAAACVPKGVDLMIGQNVVLHHRYAWRSWLVEGK